LSGGKGRGGQAEGFHGFQNWSIFLYNNRKKKKKARPLSLSPCLYLSACLSLSLSLSLSFWCASRPSSLSLSLSLSWFFSTSLCRVYRWYLYAQMQIQRHQCKYHWWHVGVSLPLVLQWETHNVHKCRYRDTNVISLYWCLCAI